MIKGIISSSPYISVSGINPPYISMGTPSSGMIRYNGNSSNIEVYDGSYWQAISNFQSLELTPKANEILDWAFKKMEEEKAIIELAKKNPTVNAALNEFKHAEDRLKVVIGLCQE